MRIFLNGLKLFFHAILLLVPELNLLIIGILVRKSRLVCARMMGVDWKSFTCCCSTNSLIGPHLDLICHFLEKLTDFLLEFPFFFLPDFFVCNNFKILAMVSPPADAERLVLDWEEILLLMLCYTLFVGGFQGGY